MAKRKTSGTVKIKKYRKPLNINIGMVIFAVIFIYVCICISMYFKDNHIKPYEVREGSLAAENLYTGIALRDEIVVTAEDAGYINYYAREGERVAVRNLVYTLDETGRLSDYINNTETGENGLSNADLEQLKRQVTHFVRSFSADNFASAYEFKFSLKGNVLKLANSSLMEGIGDIQSDLNGMVSLSRAPETGIVMCWQDGYEELMPEMITADMFKKTGYEKKQMVGNELVAQGDFVYKLCNNENWSIVIPVTEEKAAELQEAEYVKIRFMKNQTESWGFVTIYHNQDGRAYAKLSFTNSMVSFVTDRFVEIELLMHEEKGLKIPNTAIVEREFFLIPEAFLTKSGNADSTGVLREAVKEDGTKTTEYIEVNVYSLEEGEYYVDAGALKSGDHLFMPDSSETYTVSKRATLIGVYNMNKGYADFRQIEILYQNEEYAIVKSNTTYGLNVYDLIVQNASGVKVDQFIYK